MKTLQRVYWRVKVWGNHDEVSLFSEYAFFEMGLLHTSDWHALWIEPEKEVQIDVYKPAPYIRKEFTVRKGLAQARASFTAKGIYHFYLNGMEGTDHLFTPDRWCLLCRTGTGHAHAKKLTHCGRSWCMYGQSDQFRRARILRS
nr:hypothetical protein [Paenibacillus sp. Leaf72]